MDKEFAESLLRAADVFYEDEPDKWNNHRRINMNDTFGWALAYGPYVSDENLVEVGELFLMYGMAGLYYWCTVCPEEERLDGSEFEDVQRAIDFVRHEEKLRKSGMKSHERAYHKMTYTLGKRNAA